MSKKIFNPQECIAPLNNVKKGMQIANHPFSKEAILNGLKGCGLPTNATFWTVFRNSGLIQETSRGKFMFTSKDPIYVGRLETIKNEYQKRLRRYKDSTKKAVPEQPKETQTEELPENDPKAMTQFAIDLLKEQGYKILAPVGIVYQPV